MERTALSIVRLLQKKGYQTYFAGGWVRDFLLGKEHADIDIATSALPDEIEQLLQKTIPIGKQFGVIQTIKNGHKFEIATFRSDAGYSDGRRPDAVYFHTPEKDAERRDFTINGMFYDPIEKKLIDFVNGKRDLKMGLITFIGDPATRVREDHLRILRAVRFRWSLDFQYHPDTYQALKKYNQLIKHISGERIRDELIKILSLKNRGKALRELSELGILKHILPELEKCRGVAQPAKWHLEGDVWEHSIRSVETLSAKAPLRLVLATLFHDIGKPDTFKLAERIRFDHHVERSAEISEQILRRLKFSNKEIEEISWLIRHHMMIVPMRTMPLGRRRHWFTHPLFPTLLKLNYADEKGSDPIDLTMIRAIETEYRDYRQYLPRVKKPLLSGGDVMKILNLKAGKKIGKILEQIRYLQLEHKLNNKKEALAWLKKSK